MLSLFHPSTPTASSFFFPFSPSTKNTHNPQILKVLPYSATQLCAYEALKRALADKETGDLSLPARLLAGAAAGMGATAATHPLDTLRLRMAVDPASPTLTAAARTLLASGGPRALYRGLGASLAGIAPYMAIELAAFDVLGAAAEKAKKEAESGGGKAGAGGNLLGLINGFGRGATAALIATSVCYPLDTARRRVQLAGAAGGEGLLALVRRVADTGGAGALYRGFWPNAAKNLPNKGVKLGTFDAAKKLLGRAQVALEEERGRVVRKKKGERVRVQLG
jgi:solute carrier family 25 (mitochondrial phosphate transporter), member 23/24/25/41